MRTGQTIRFNISLWHRTKAGYHADLHVTHRITLVRPSRGTVDRFFNCPYCGEQFVAEVPSLHTLEREIIPRRQKRASTLIVVALLLCVLGIVLPLPFGLTAGLTAGWLFFISIGLYTRSLHRRITGVGTLRYVSDGKPLTMPGLHTHRIV